MSKFIKGDIVDIPWFNGQDTRGIVHTSWGRNINSQTGIPRVEIFLFEDGFVGHFDEDQVELALDEYEFIAVVVDQEDFEQTSLGSGYEWGTLEEAQRLIQAAKDVDTELFYMDDRKLQINRRRKAGPTIGYHAY